MSFSRSVSPGARRADFARAEELFAANGQELEYAKARHNLGLVALSRGDLPEALSYFDEAGSRYDALGETHPRPRHRPLLGAAGRRAGRRGGAARPTPRSARYLRAGGIAYKNGGAALRGRHRRPGRGRPGRGQSSGHAQARRLFRAQGRALWEARAGLVLAEARYAAGEHSAALVPVRRGGRRPSRGVPGWRGDAGAPARRAHRPEPGQRGRSRPAPRARREVTPPRAAAAPERGLAGPGAAGRRARQRPGHRHRLRPRARRPRGAPDAARGHRVARVRHGARRRARHAGPARRAQAWRRPPAAVLERAMAGDRAGRPEHTAPGRTRS